MKHVKTSKSTTPVVVVKESSVGVDVGADVAGNKDTATTTPPAFPPPFAAAAGKVDVTAERAARVTSRTPTLPAVGRCTVVGVTAETVGKIGSGTSTPVHCCFSIALAAMDVHADAEIAMKRTRMRQNVPRAGPHTPASEDVGGGGEHSCGVGVGAAAKRVAPCVVPRSYQPASQASPRRGASVCTAWRPEISIVIKCIMCPHGDVPPAVTGRRAPMVPTASSDVPGPSVRTPRATGA